MTDFEGMFALFGLMFGLILAELSIKFADAIDSHYERPIGVLTPLLALLLVTDVTSFWLFAWGARNEIYVTWPTVFGGVLVAIVYFLAATLIFPRSSRVWERLDDHYWARKRLVAAGILLTNVMVEGSMMTIAVPGWTDWWFYFNFGGYAVALMGLTLSRSRRLDLLFLVWTIGINLGAGFNLTGTSEWGKQIGLRFDAQQQPAPHR